LYGTITFFNRRFHEKLQKIKDLISEKAKFNGAAISKRYGVICCYRKLIWGHQLARNSRLSLKQHVTYAFVSLADDIVLVRKME